MARMYLKLIRGGLSKSEVEEYITSLRRSGEEDLLLGALLRGTLAQDTEEIHRLAAASRDPWVELVAMRRRASTSSSVGDYRQARQQLEYALSFAREGKITYPTLGLRHDLVDVLISLGELGEAWEQVSVALDLSRRLGAEENEDEFLVQLADIAQLRTDHSLARAYLEEAALRSQGNVAQEQHVHERRARLEVAALKPAEARVAIDRAIAMGKPLSLDGAFALADIARYQSKPSDNEVLETSLQALSPKSKGLEALVQHVRGRFYSASDPDKGRALLRRAIQMSEALVQTDVNARRARAFGYAQLILEAGREQNFAQALRYFAEESGILPPARCAVGIAEEAERALWVVRDAHGFLSGQYEASRISHLPGNLKEFLPSSVVQRLRACEMVAVLAQPSLHGRPGILPPEIAWSYRTGGHQAHVTGSHSLRRLVVANVEISSAYSLPQLEQWVEEAGPETNLLAGTWATPARVLEEMATATEIMLVAHGQVSSDGVRLVLAQDDEGHDGLDARQIRATRLEGAPLVILAACSTARSSQMLHERVSLPSAFIEAGARAVMAPTVSIPDRRAFEFFNSVLDRIRRGAPPATALRDERMQWLRSEGDREGWVTNILLFD